MHVHVLLFYTFSLKELRSHVLWKHPNADRTELDKLTGNIHRVQGKMGWYKLKVALHHSVFGIICLNLRLS